MIATFFLRLEKLVLFKETLFGLPWMMTGLLLASIQPEARLFSWQEFTCLIGAFTAARFSGMCFNRFIDRHIDAKNARTAKRALPTGEISPLFCGIQATLFLLLFFFFSFCLSMLSLALAIGMLLLLYSYAKRFTFMCHFILGLIHLFSPLCAWMVVTGSFSFVPLILGGALLCSITAGDIIYACQDREFDKKANLYSIPARFGQIRAFLIARLLHFLAVLMLLGVGYLLDVGPCFYLGLFCIAGLYLFAHRRQASGKDSFDTTFRFTNTLAAFTLFATVCGELLWRRVLL